MSITDNGHKLDRILESATLNKYELIDLPKEQPGDSSNEYTGFWIIEAKGTLAELHLGIDPFQGPSLSPLCENELEIANMQLGFGRGMVTCYHSLYIFACDSFDCALFKNLQIAIIKTSHSNLGLQ